MANTPYYVDGQAYYFPDEVTPEQAQQILQQQGVIKPAPAAAGPPPVVSSGLGRQALQGLTFGFGDEIMAGGRALRDTWRNGGSLGDHYHQDVADERGQLKQYEGEHPLVSLGANIAGGLPWMLVPVAGEVRGASLGRTAWNALKTGAAMGAISGAGAGEGDGWSRFRHGLAGGVTGGTIGAAVPALGRAGSRVMQAVADAGAGSWVGRAAGMLPGVTAPGAARAEEKVLQALQRDGMGVDDAAAKVAEWKATGKPFGLADVGGMNTRGLGDAAMTVPNATRNQVSDQLTGRGMEQGERIATDLSRGTGVLSDAIDTGAKLAAQREAAARPLYAAAYKAGAAPITDPRITQILRFPRFQSVLKRAADIAELEGQPLTRAADGSIIPDLRALDYVKRGLDDELYSGKATGSLGKAEQRALGDVRHQMVDILDQTYPQYAQARAAYAGPTRSLEALEAGQEFWRMDPREVRDLLANEYATPAEREHYLLGAVDQIRSMVRSSPDGADVYKRVFGSDQKRELLRLLFPNPQSFENFQKSMSVEKAMRVTQDAIRGNSRTMSRAAEVADLGGDSLNMLTNPKKAIMDSMLQRLFGRVTGENAEAVLPLLFNDPTGALARLQAAQGRYAAQSQRRLLTPRSLGIASGVQQPFSGYLGGLLGR